MSHLARIELEIRDLTALEKACKRMGLHFMRNQKTFKWYGTWVGDTPLPADMKVEDFGKCEHAIKAPGCDYEVGVVRRGAGYGLVWDYWGAGGLENAIGKNGGLIKQAYTLEKAKMECIRKGYSVREIKTERGIQLRMEVR